MIGIVDENIHPCIGCEDYIRPNGCKSNGGCSPNATVNSVLIEVLQEIMEEIKGLPTISFNKNDVYKADVFKIIDRHIEELEK